MTRRRIGAGRSVSVLDVIDAVGQATGTKPRVEHVPAKTGEMPAVVVSIDRARALGYHPEVALPEGLASVWADFQAADPQAADAQAADPQAADPQAVDFRTADVQAAGTAGTAVTAG